MRTSSQTAPATSCRIRRALRMVGSQPRRLRIAHELAARAPSVVLAIRKVPQEPTVGFFDLESGGRRRDAQERCQRCRRGLSLHESSPCAFIRARSLVQSTQYLGRRRECGCFGGFFGAPHSQFGSKLGSTAL